MLETLTDLWHVFLLSRFSKSCYFFGIFLWSVSSSSISASHPSYSVLPRVRWPLWASGAPCRPGPGRTSLFLFSLHFSQFKMAALSSAESPPPVFNGDAAEREPGRERGLEEPASGYNTACTTRIPGGAQNEEVSAATLWLAGLTRGRGSGHRAERRSGM